MEVKIMDVGKIRSLLFFVGVGLLALASISVTLNHKQGTLNEPSHASAIAILGAAGLGCLWIGTHFQGFNLTATPATPPQQPKAVAAQPAQPVTPVAESSTAGPRDKTGQYVAPAAIAKDLQAVWHLAEAAAETDPKIRGDVLDVCRELNDKFFVIHHKILIETNDAPKKNPTVAS